MGARGPQAKPELALKMLGAAKRFPKLNREPIPPDWLEGRALRDWKVLALRLVESIKMSEDELNGLAEFCHAWSEVWPRKKNPVFEMAEWHEVMDRRHPSDKLWCSDWALMDWLSYGALVYMELMSGGCMYAMTNLVGFLVMAGPSDFHDWQTARNNSYRNLYELWAIVRRNLYFLETRTHM